MSDLFGGSQSTSYQVPMNFTPGPYKALQPLIASTLAQLLVSGGPAYTTGNVLGNTPNMTVTTPPPTTPPPTTGGTGGTGGGTQLPWQTGGQTFPWSNGGNRRSTPLRNGNTPGGGYVPPTPATPTTPTTPASTTSVVPNPNYQPPTPSSLVAPLTQQQMDVINSIAAQANTQPGSNPLSDAINQQLLATISGQNLQGNPFLDAAIQAAQYGNLRNFQDTVVPELLSRYTGRGQEVQGSGSSAFANASNTAARDFEQTQSAVDTNMRYQNYNAERDRQIQAITQGNQVTNDQMQRLVTALQAVSLPQQVQDLGIQRGLQEYQNRLNTLLETLRIAGGLSSPTVATGGSSSSSSSNGIAGLIGGVSFGL